MSYNKDFGLVLGGGAGLGFAHLGVLQYLEEIRCKPNIITGTSMGALIGGLYACGKNVGQIIEMLDTFNNFKIIDIKLFPLTSQALLRSEKINKFLQELFGDTQIEDLKVKFGCVAVDIVKGELCEITSGSLWKAVRASISVPAVFEPFEMGEKRFIDGGVMDNLPTNLAKKLGAKCNIAINAIDYDKAMLKPKTLVHCLINALSLSQKEMIKVKTQTDLLVSLSLDNVSMISFNKENALKAYTQGYNQTKYNYGEKICNLLNVK